MAAPTRRPRTVVITGGSSGIGLATALAFARRGDRLVLAARGRLTLEQAAAACAEAGAQVLAVPTDVADAEQVERLARAAEDRFGGIDVWVNNAAVAMFGRFEELPSADVARLLDVNVKGYAWGAQSALRRFRRQRAGTLVLVGSTNGRIGSPLTAPYVMSKFAITGMAESLRMELAGERDIHVSTVLPAPVDTPLWARAANHLGEAVGPAGPAFDAERVAAAVVRCADHHPREIEVGWTGTVGRAAHRAFPAAYEAAGARILSRAYRRDGTVPPNSGNLHRPTNDDARIEGGWSAARRRMTRGAIIASAAAGVAAIVVGRVRR